MKIIVTFDWLSKWVENKFYDSMRFIDIASIEGECVATVNATFFIFLLHFFSTFQRGWYLSILAVCKKMENKYSTTELKPSFTVSVCCCLLFLCCRLFLCANSIFSYRRWRHNTKMKPSWVGQKEMENTEKCGINESKTKKMQQKQKIPFECSKRQQ